MAATVPRSAATTGRSRRRSATTRSPRTERARPAGAGRVTPRVRPRRPTRSGTPRRQAQQPAPSAVAQRFGSRSAAPKRRNPRSSATRTDAAWSRSGRRSVATRWTAWRPSMREQCSSCRPCTRVQADRNAARGPVETVLPGGSRQLPVIGSGCAPATQWPPRRQSRAQARHRSASTWRTRPWPTVSLGRIAPSSTTGVCSTSSGSRRA